MVYIDIKGEVVDSGSEWIYQWFGIQAVSPKIIQNKLDKANGDDVTVRINSGGGSVFAGCEIFNALKSYSGQVTIEILGLCASIAGVIAMAGDVVKMSPLAQFMMHNVSCKAQGDYRDMEHTAEVLKKANSTISNAYKMKTGMKDEEVKTLMNAESWFTAQECLDKKLVDEIMYMDNKVDATMLNMLKNSAISMCNSISLSNDLIQKFKNLNPGMAISQQIINDNQADFFIKKKAKAELELLNLRKKVL